MSRPRRRLPGDAAGRAHAGRYRRHVPGRRDPRARVAGGGRADGGLRAVLLRAPAQRVPADLVVPVPAGPGFEERLPPSPAPGWESLGSPSRLLPPPLVRAHGEAERIMMAA